MEIGFRKARSTDTMARLGFFPDLGTRAERRCASYARNHRYHLTLFQEYLQSLSENLGLDGIWNLEENREVLQQKHKVF